ncbi:MAG: ABC transporter permease, partial [Acidobacteriota bacterium]
LALMLGIGLPATMYSIVNGALRGLPFEESERILYVGRSDALRGIPLTSSSLQEYRYWQQNQSSFEHLSAFWDTTVSLSGESGFAEQYRAAYMTADTFEMLRVQPLIGRLLQAEDQSRTASPVVLLGHSVWRNRYDSDPHILGQQVRIEGQPKTVIGVMPEGFLFPAKERIWMPLILDQLEEQQGAAFRVDVAGRLKDGLTVEEARSEFELLSMQLEAEEPEKQGIRAVIVPYTQKRMGDLAPILYTMLGAVSFVLLVACANVANLLLARAVTRTREVAIRAALGASRLRLAGHFLAESFAISALGGLLGLGVAYAGVTFFNHGITGNRANMAFWIDIRVDPATIAFAAALVFAGSLAAGAVPAWRTSRTDVNQVLKQESLASAGLRLGRLSRVMLVGQIAFSCALMVISVLMIKGVAKLKTFDFGFPAAETLSAEIELPRSKYPTAAQRQEFFRRLDEELRSRPSLEQLAYVSTLPGRGSPGWPLSMQGKAVERDEDLPLTSRLAVSPEYFSLLESGLLGGRGFGLSDNFESPLVAIVNQGFADRFYPGENPIGRQITLGRGSWKQPARIIVGLVPNLHVVNLELNQPDADGVYVPFNQTAANQTHLLMRASDPMALAPMLRQAVHQLDADLPVAQIDRLDRAVLQDKLLLEVFAGLFLFFGLAALFLASVGLYGIVAFTVRQRSREMGIRRALGAGSRHILGQVLGRGAVQVAAGLALGLSIAALISPILAEGFFQTDPHDPSVFLMTALLLASTGLAACLAPARKALRTAPLEALRYE